jgi:hypothetical protein
LHAKTISLSSKPLANLSFLAIWQQHGPRICWIFILFVDVNLGQDFSSLYLLVGIVGKENSLIPMNDSDLSISEKGILARAFRSGWKRQRELWIR